MTVCITYHVDEVTLKLEELQPIMLKVWVVVRFDHDAPFAACTYSARPQTVSPPCRGAWHTAAWPVRPRIVHTSSSSVSHTTTILYLLLLLLHFKLFFFFFSSLPRFFFLFFSSVVVV